MNFLNASQSSGWFHIISMNSSSVIQNTSFSCIAWLYSTTCIEKNQVLGGKHMKIVERGKSVAINLCIMALAVAVSLTGCSGGGGSVDASTNVASSSNQSASSTPDDSAPSSSSSSISSSAPSSSSSVSSSSETVEDGYISKPGWVFACSVAKDGTLYGGALHKLNELNKQYDLCLERFPSNIDENGGSDYILDGKTLKYLPVRICNPKCFSKNNGIIAIYETKSNGRIKLKCMASIGSKSASEYVNEFYPGCNYFEEYPEYLQYRPDNFIWDGHTLTYDSINK